MIESSHEVVQGSILAFSHTCVYIFTMSDDHDDGLSDDSEEEEDWGGVWDDRCREICHDMRLNKSNGDHFASERVQELLKKNSQCARSTLSYLNMLPC